MDYDLTRLGHAQFARLVRDIIRNVLGIDAQHADSIAAEAAELPNLIEPNSSGLVSVYTGRIGWPAGSTQQIWQGTVFIKSYFLNPAVGPDSNMLTILQSIERQLRDWRTSKKSRTRRGKTISYLFYVCNVPLDRSADPQLQELLNEYKELGIKKYQFWDYRRLCQIIDNQQAIRREYSGLIASRNVMADLSSYIDLPDPSFGEIINRHLSMDLVADQWVRLSQTGLSNQQKLALSSVAIDLPARSPDDLLHAASHILSVGNQVLRPSQMIEKTSPSLVALETKQKPPPHIVLVGGPGQGKTTIGQLVCQVYRTALLLNGPQLSQEASNLLGSVRESITRVGLHEPINRRWPIRIDLAAFADAASGPRNVALLRYIAQQVGSRTSEKVEPAAMRTWLRNWPWLLVLDGLDEVASQGGRDFLMQRVSEFFIEAAQADCDLLIVATTRPQGYTGEFSAERYRHISLSPLSPAEAASYAKRLAEVQHASDPDLLIKVIERTRIASEEESTARLMRTPLQVTIMSLLLESRERAPQARYALFEAYYQAIYSREATKPGPLGRLLEELRPHINALHDRVGLLLQVQAEQIGEADAMLPQNELRSLAALRLRAEGFANQEAEQIAEQVLKAVTQRLVLIVPKGLEDVGFEVRSIQEFMAARALVAGRDTAVLSRLQILIPSVHWRNTWLFAAGRVFYEREHLRRDLVTVVEDTDSQNVLNVVVAPGADLALDLLDDDLAVSTPALQRALARHALTLLRCPPDKDLKRRAGALYRCASMDPVVRAAIDQAIAEALGGSVSQQLAAYQLLEAWRNETGGLGLRARQIIWKLQNAEARSPKQDDRSSRFVISEVMNSVLDEETLEPSDRLRIESLVINNATNDHEVNVSSIVDQCLSSQVCATAVAKVVVALAAKPIREAVRLRDLLRNWLGRTASGAEVLRQTPFPDHIDESH